MFNYLLTFACRSFRCKQKKLGFSLVEVLVAVLLLSTSLVLIMRGMHEILFVWNLATQRVRGMMVAQEAFSQIQRNALGGVLPQSAGQVVVEDVSGDHPGLFRLRYLDDAGEGGAAYEVLVYVAPDGGAAP
jgi:type II secretory pathway pseudopilin PulG